MFKVAKVLTLEGDRPPYEHLFDGTYDGWRVFWRNRRKQIGLPASSDVGALSGVVVPLRQRAEARLGIKVSAAGVSVPHLPALYQDDIQDILAYGGMAYLIIDGYFRRLLWETAVGYAGHGLGLCTDYRDVENCRRELRQMPQRDVLSVHYAPNALTLSLAVLETPLMVWEPRYRHDENFTLGSDRERGADAGAYWDELRAAVESFLFRQVGAYLPADTVIFLGASAPAREDDPFARLVLETLEKKQSRPSTIYLKDAVFAAARGTAELVKRDGCLADGYSFRCVDAKGSSGAITGGRGEFCSGSQPCKDFL